MHSSIALQMRPKIQLSLTQLRMAAKKYRAGLPICHEETMRVINGLEAADGEVAPVYKYIKQADKCMEEAKREKKRRKASTLYHLTKFLVQKK